jgi:hypothetical protein
MGERALKRPSFQFYPKDWRDEQALRLCSMAARGLWIDLMCLMHSSDRYGHLEVAGKPMSVEQIARLVGDAPKDVRAWMAELSDNGVCSFTAEGVMFSRRMVRDEAIREKRAAGGDAGSSHGYKGAEHGSKGGRPKKQEGGEKPPFDESEKPPSEPPPSSASSSASSTSKETPLRDLAIARDRKRAFEEWWQGYPRKVGKADAEKAWIKLKPDEAMQTTLTEAVAKQREWDSWRREGGRFIPHAATWLNGRRWLDEGDAGQGVAGYDYERIARMANLSEETEAAGATD